MEHVLRCLFREDTSSPTDGQLLEGFLRHGQQAAFEALLCRHGPMVLGVCRRILKNTHDAEDAFQATFLVLVRKAASLSQRSTVGNWLYGVAYHTALKARATTLKRREKERRASEIVRQERRLPSGPDDWSALLDQELNRLPEKYRSPVVLCDLEGQSYKKAAQVLGWPEGTVSGRLFRARAILAKRLTLRGVTVPSTCLGIAGLALEASAAVPTALIHPTIRAAGSLLTGESGASEFVSARVMTLTQGVLNAMWMNKLKVVLSVLLVLSGLGGSLVWLGQVAPPQRAAAQSPREASPEKDKSPVKEKPAKEAAAQVRIAEAQVEVMRAQVEVAEAQVAVAEANLAQAVSEAEFRHTTLNQATELLKNKATGEQGFREAKAAATAADHEVAAKRAAVLTAKARVKVAQAQVKVAEAQVAAAKEQP